ncbi:SagB/ThcOx family dehydrogenase [Actinomadura litoris]|uniref:SagB/ThcOx family dehydrogenase n=1 Tax=Actinomadura litoris TaxID=2678616 RepID=UPI001FA6B4C7|nr:SagB family peptide dehydrogenase [Actinomadura litoris]
MIGSPETRGVLTERLTLVAGVYSAIARDGRLRLVIGSRFEDFGPAEPWKSELLKRLVTGAADAADGRAAELVGRLREGGWLTTEVLRDGVPLYAVQPTSRPEAVADAEPGGEAVLSRFAVVHREDGHLVVESPLSWGRVHLHDPALFGVVGGVGAAGPAARRLERDLLRMGLAVTGDEDEDEVRLRQWSVHELWFHRRSRLGDRDRLGGGYGRTRWADGVYEEPPFRREPYPGEPIPLHRPDLAELRHGDPTLSAVVEDRRSVRVHDDASPITLEELGEFLYRCARIRMVPSENGGHFTGRPYPSGGSAYELELYPIVRLASGLDAGAYHYDGHDHVLRRVREPGAETARLLATARQGTLVRAAPQVLIVVTARFGRLMRAYEQMPYSLILKHVGVLYQTMYLVATAMGLAPCGLGGGDSRTFNAVTGTGFTEEGAVGEFMLGSRPASTYTETP